MRSKASDGKLKEALKDPDAGVVLAAANALRLIGDPIAYEVYYAVLTGERKSGAGLTRRSEENAFRPEENGAVRL